MAKPPLPDFSKSEIGQRSDPVDRFFAYARERQSILLKKEAGFPPPWTNDPILAYYKFCNIFREDDKTTRWFRTNVRNPWDGDSNVLLATVVFRLFNRIETGNIIFGENTFWGNSLFDRLSTGEGSMREIEQAIRYINPRGKWVTGAYIITSPPGYDKLEGICRNIKYFMENKFLWRGTARYWGEVAIDLVNADGDTTLQELWTWLKQVPYFGPFHSYEMVTDLRHTYLLDRASDINTWANAGPGAKRGLNRVNQRPLDHIIKDPNKEMQDLLALSRDTKYWPNNEQYPKWELREVEQWNCEVDKIERVRTGVGKPRSIYR